MQTNETQTEEEVKEECSLETLELKINKIENLLSKQIEPKNENASIKTFASVLMAGSNTDSPNKATLVQQANLIKQRNGELIEKKERESRACNVVIHGRHFWTSEGDNKYVDSLLKDLSVGAIKPQKVDRIGRNVEKGRVHPMILKFKSSEDKDKVMANLNQLKGREEYKGIRITEDYTPAELEMIKGMREEARIENRKDSNKSFIWVIRGDPKNGMFLKRTKKSLQ